MGTTRVHQFVADRRLFSTIWNLLAINYFFSGVTIRFYFFQVLIFYYFKIIVICNFRLNDRLALEVWINIPMRP